MHNDHHKIKSKYDVTIVLIVAQDGAHRWTSIASGISGYPFHIVAMTCGFDLCP